QLHTLALHGALPISPRHRGERRGLPLRARHLRQGDSCRTRPGSHARPRRQVEGARDRRLARGVYPARDRPARRETLRRLSLRLEAHAYPQEAREGTKRSRHERTFEGEHARDLEPALGYGRWATARVTTGPARNDRARR